MAQLVLEVRTDERIERVYREEADRLWRALLAYSRDGNVASDALSEAFAQAISRGDAVRDPARWVWRAAFRIAAGELAGRTGTDAPLDAAFIDPGFTLAEDSVLLLSALAKLPDRQRAVIVLHYLVDLSTAEIASRLGVNPITVRVHLNQGRKRLEHILRNQHG